MKTFAHRILDALQSVSSHVAGVSIGSKSDKATWRVDWDGSQSQANVDAVAAYLAGAQPGDFEGPAVDTGELRAEAIAMVNADTTQHGKAYRAVATVLVDEENAIRSWLTDFKAAVAGAATLAALKTAVAALPNMPARTLAQAKTAVQNAINSGTID
jgi:hypothetical protein